MNFKSDFGLNFNTTSLFHLNCKKSFGFLPIKGKSLGLLNFHYSSFVKLFSQPAHNIPGKLNECSLSAVMFRASREHLGNILKENIFKKSSMEKLLFVLKVYDLTITNVDLLANSSNYKVMFPEYSKNIPRISVSKTFQG